MRRRLSSILTTGLALFLGSPLLHALTPMEYFRKHVSPTMDSGDDGLLFHTNEGRVLVLADDRGRIGAILVHTKKRTQQAENIVNKLLPLVQSDEEPDISYSKDGYSALVFYAATAEKASGEDESIIEINRLGAIYNIRLKEDEEWLPHRWHDGGISFRYYDDGELAAEITPDLTEETVSYAEIRISNNYRALLPTSLAGHEHRLPDNRAKLRQLSHDMSGATILSSDSFGSTHVTRRKDVSTVGTTERLRRANKSRRDMGHYIFPEFVFPRQKANISPPSNTPRPKGNTPAPKQNDTKLTEDNSPPAAPQQKEQRPQTYTPEQARKAYIDYLNQLR